MVKRLGEWGRVVHAAMLKEPDRALLVTEIIEAFGHFPGRTATARVMVLYAASGFFSSRYEVGPKTGLRGVTRRITRYVALPVDPARVAKPRPSLRDQRIAARKRNQPCFRGVASIFDLAVKFSEQQNETP